MAASTIIALGSGVLTILFLSLILAAFYENKMEREEPKLGDYEKAKYGFGISTGIFGFIFMISSYFVFTYTPPPQQQY